MSKIDDDDMRSALKEGRAAATAVQKAAEQLKPTADRVGKELEVRPGIRVEFRGDEAGRVIEEQANREIVAAVSRAFASSPLALNAKDLALYTALVEVVPEVALISDIRDLKDVVNGNDVSDDILKQGIANFISRALNLPLDRASALIASPATHAPNTRAKEADRSTRSMPDTAPEKWPGSRGNPETPPQFIKRVYGDWLGHGLDRAHIRALDKPLWQALYNWLRQNEMPSDVDLPTRVDQNTRWVERVQAEGVGVLAEGFGGEQPISQLRRLEGLSRRRLPTQTQKD